jgi:predicted nucleotidyltransferase
MTKDSRLQLDDLNYNRLTALLRRYIPGVRALVYGSRAGGKPRKYSDIDLVVFTNDEQARAVNDLREALDDSSIPYRVDLWEWSKTPHTWRAAIEANGIAI